jgi:hypothetical protein
MLPVQRKFNQKVIDSQSTEIIKYMCSFMKEDTKDRQQIPFKKTTERVAEATGLSMSTIK